MTTAITYFIDWTASGRPLAGGIPVRIYGQPQQWTLEAHWDHFIDWLSYI